MKQYVYTEIEGQKLRLSNLDKVIYPDSEITKAEIIEYYLKIADHFLLYSANAPVTLIRFPDGIDKASFYGKTAPEWRPDWTKTQSIVHSEETIPYLVVDSKASLVWCANVSGLEIHPMQMTIEQMDYPGYFVFDIDPDPQQDFDSMKEIVVKLKVFLESFGFTPFVKTSGSKGFHIFVPIVKNYTHEQLTTSVKKIAQLFVDQNKKETTLVLNKAKRKGKILVDIYRNHKVQSTVAPYSLRGKPGAPISFPFNWDYLNKISSSQWVNIRNVDEHLINHKDAWTPFDDSRAELPFVHDAVKKGRIEASTSKPASPIPSGLEHMLAGVSKKLPENGGCIFEIKWDGIRVFIYKDFESVKITSRSGRDITKSFGDVVDSVRKYIQSDQVVFDGELVCLDDQGRPVFADIISRMHQKNVLNHKKPVVAYLFDCVWKDGEAIHQKPLVERQKEIQIIKNNQIRLSDTFDDGQALLAAAKSMGLEGIMIKKKNSTYQFKQRSEDWVKYKFRTTATCKIIGFTDGKGDRKGVFGSMHLIENLNDEWVYRGRVGTGLDQAKLKVIYNKMKPFVTSIKPIKDKVDEELRTHWINAELYCEIQYASLTPNGTFREPVFLHLREDITS